MEESSASLFPSSISGTDTIYIGISGIPIRDISMAQKLIFVS